MKSFTTLLLGARKPSSPTIHVLEYTYANFEIAQDDKKKLEDVVEETMKWQVALCKPDR